MEVYSWEKWLLIIGYSIYIYSTYIYIHIYIYIYIIIYIWVNYNDLTATSLESWLVREIILKWPNYSG